MRSTSKTIRGELSSRIVPTFVKIDLAWPLDSAKAADAIYDVELRQAWARWMRKAIDGLVEEPPTD
jgi:hypothetical protein